MVKKNAHLRIRCEQRRARTLHPLRNARWWLLIVVIIVVIVVVVIVAASTTAWAAPALVTRRIPTRIRSGIHVDNIDHDIGDHLYTSAAAAVIVTIVIIVIIVVTPAPFHTNEAANLQIDLCGLSGMDGDIDVVDRDHIPGDSLDGTFHHETRTAIVVIGSSA